MRAKRCLALVFVAVCAAVMVRGLVAAPLRPSDPVAHRTILLGRSGDGRAITVVESGDTDSPRKALVVGCIHGNECAGIAVAARLARTPPPGETDLWIVSDLNPDGLAAGTRGNGRGVDLNRNFSWHWTRLTGVYYSGAAPLSEPETRIAARLILRVRPSVSIWFHQHLDVVDDSSGSLVVERRFARAAGLRLAPYTPRPRLRLNGDRFAAALSPREGRETIVGEMSEAILVVDDDASIRRMLERTFVAEGYRVEGVSDGGAALAADRKSTRLNSSHRALSRMPSSA